MHRSLLFFLFALTLAACKEDPCSTVTCLNGGTCLDGLGTCQCQPGFEGDSCQTNTFQRFIGTFSADYGNCLDTSPAHEVGIEQAGGSNALRILNLGDYECPAGTLQVEATVTGTLVQIAEQTVNCGSISYTFSGSGRLEGELIRIDFVATYDADGFLRTDACSVNLEKK